MTCDNTGPALLASSLLTPASGAYLSGGISYVITWNTGFYASESSPSSTPISIDYATASGASWTNLATSIANGGSFTWTVPAVNLPSAQIRLTATDKLGNTTSVIKSFTIDSTNPAVAADTITSPNGGGYFKGSTGTGIAISWNPAKLSDTNLSPTPITLEYSTNGTLWNTIASNLANSGSYLWSSLPALNAATVRIRLTATDLVGKTGTDTSDADFTIDSTLPTITINTPPTPPNNAFISA